MKINTLILFAILLITSCGDKTETTSDTKKENKQLRHIVLLSFKEATTAIDVKKVESAFISLPSKINEIKDFEWGLNNSPEALNKDFTHCFFVTFNSEEGRSKYLPHPAHKAFVAVLSPHLKDVLVIDYWAK